MDLVLWGRAMQTEFSAASLGSMVSRAVAIDLGGTKISWALTTSSYQVAHAEQIPTPSTTDEIIAAIESIVSAALSRANNGIKGIGIGVAGLVDPRSGEVVAAPNLPLTGVNFRQRIADLYGLDCFVENDANLAAFGELCCGFGLGKRNFIGLTVGTGIGGGIVIDGKLYHGSLGGAAEFGHMVVSEGGPECGCGNRGCLEALASGRALERLGREFAKRYPQSDLAALSTGENGPTGMDIAAAAENGNQEALGILSEAAGWLGVGIANLINIFDPEIVVIGGGVSTSLKLVLTTVNERVDSLVINPGSREVPIVISELENNAGLLGAAGLVFETP